MKISKEAISNLSFPLILIGMADLMTITGQFDVWATSDILLIVGFNLFGFYFITESGYERLKWLFKNSLKFLIYYVLPAVVIGFLVMRFLSLPPTSIVIILLLLIWLKK